MNAAFGIKPSRLTSISIFGLRSAKIKVIKYRPNMTYCAVPSDLHLHLASILLLLPEIQVIMKVQCLRSLNVIAINLQPVFPASPYGKHGSLP